MAAIVQRDDAKRLIEHRRQYLNLFCCQRADSLRHWWMRLPDAARVQILEECGVPRAAAPRARCPEGYTVEALMARDLEEEPPNAPPLYLPYATARESPTTRASAPSSRTRSSRAESRGPQLDRRPADGSRAPRPGRDARYRRYDGALRSFAIVADPLTEWAPTVARRRRGRRRRPPSRDSPRGVACPCTYSGDVLYRRRRTTPWSGWIF